jgi:GntR family transcriptional regulator
VARNVEKESRSKNQSLLGTGATGVPRYTMLASLFRKHISTGEWKFGEQIPTGENLAASHGIAIGTVQKALLILANENLIRSVPGKGTFVIHNRDDKTWYEVHSDWKDFLLSRQGATIETLAEETCLKPELGPWFIGKVANSYRCFRRRHWYKGESFLLSKIFIEESLLRRSTSDGLSSDSGARLISESPRLKRAEVHQRMTVGSSDLEIAEKLGLQPHAPVVFVSRYATDAAKRLLFAGECIYRGDAFQLSMHIDMK